MEINILKKNVDVKHTTVVNDEFNFEYEKVKFINTDVKEIQITDILKYCYPVVTYIRYESIRDVAIRNLVNVKQKEYEYVENLYTTNYDLDGFMVITQDKTAHDNTDIDLKKLKKIRIPKDTSIQINKFILFHDYTKHQTFPKENRFKIKDLALKGNYDKLRYYLIDKSYVMSDDILLLKDAILNNFEIFESQMLYIRDLFSFDIQQFKIKHDETSIEVPKLFTDKTFSNLDAFYFNLSSNNVLEAYYSYLLNLPNRTNQYLEDKKNLDKNILLKKQNASKLELKTLENILFDNFAKRKFKKAYLLLTDKEKNVVKADYENYKNRTNNNCEHRKAKDVSKYIKNDGPRDEMRKCKLCGFDLICPHQLIKEKTKEKLTPFITIIGRNYYCNICNEKIITNIDEEDMIFTKVKVQSNEEFEINELTQMLFVDAMFVVKNYVRFSTVINIQNFVRNIIDIIGEKINSISVKLHKNKTSNPQANYNIIKIHSYCYIVACILYIITTNPAEVEIDFVIKKTANENDTFQKVDQNGTFQNENSTFQNENSTLLTPIPIPVLAQEYDSEAMETKDAVTIKENDNLLAPVPIEGGCETCMKGGCQTCIKGGCETCMKGGCETCMKGEYKSVTGGSVNIKNIFNLANDIVKKLCMSYMTDANMNFDDIKSKIVDGFKDVRSVVGIITYKNTNKSDTNIKNNSNVKLLLKIHEYYKSPYKTYMDILDYEKLKSEIKIKLGKKSVDEIFELIPNIYKYIKIPPALLKPGKTDSDIILAKSCLSFIALLQNNKVDLSEEIEMEIKNKKQKISEQFLFIENKFINDFKFVLQEDIIPMKKYNVFVLDNGEKVDLKTLNNYLKEGKRFVVKEIEDKDGNNFLNTISAPEKETIKNVDPITMKTEPIEFNLIKKDILFNGFENLNKMPKNTQNLLLNLGLSEKYDYKDIANNNNIVQIYDKTRLNKLHNHLMLIVSNYNQFRNNLPYKNQLVIELLKDYDHNLLEKLQPIENLYNPDEIESILESDNIEVACQEMLEKICKFLVDVKLDIFVEKNLSKILKSDELLSKADKGELFKKDNVKSGEIEGDNDNDERVASDNDVDLESIASDVDELVNEKGEEIMDSNDNINFGTDGFDYEVESDDDGDNND